MQANRLGIIGRLDEIKPFQNASNVSCIYTYSNCIYDISKARRIEKNSEGLGVY